MIKKLINHPFVKTVIYRFRGGLISILEKYDTVVYKRLINEVFKVVQNVKNVNFEFCVVYILHFLI